MIRISTFFALLLAVMVSLTTTTKAQAVNATDSLTLVDLYNSTNGAAWASNFNWLSGPVYTWSGVTVENNQIIKIDLAFNNLSGTLPASIVNLTSLQNLDLSFNEITGNIPANIDKLSSLTTLNLSANYLSGSIPVSVSKLTNLDNLHLEFNELSGSIPAGIGNLQHLTILQLESNKLSGSIPASVNKLTQLTGLYLSHNSLSGTLPALNNDTKLVSLYLDHNQFTGDILDYFSGPSRLLTVNLSYNLLSQSTNAIYPLSHPKQNGYGNISFNHTTFNGLEYIATKMPQVIYAPQATVHLQHQGNTLSVNAGGTLSNNTYKWIKVGKAGSTTISGDSAFTPTENGKYFVQVKNSIATKLILSSDTIDFTMNNFIASNSKSSAGGNNGIVKTMQVYPNPASAIVHIQTSNKVTLVVTTATGNTVLTKSSIGKTTINVSVLPNGVYYIQNKNTGEVQKMIVQH